MRFGAHSQMFVHDIAEDPHRTLRTVRSLGMDAIEINVGDLAGFPVAAVREAQAETGLEVILGVALPARRNTISDDRVIRLAGVDHLRACVDLAHEIGARKISGGLHSANGVFVGRARTAAEWEWSVEALRAAAASAEAAGVMLTVEPVSRYSGYFLNTAADALALVDDVDSPNVKVQLDTWHMNIEEPDPVDAIRLVGAKLGHFHAVESNRGVPGTGHVPWREVFRALDDIGYDDLLVYEHFPIALPQMAVRTHTWRDIASAEQVCVEGTRLLTAAREESKGAAA